MSERTYEPPISASPAVAACGHATAGRAFAVILPVRSVGVMGDYRTCDYVLGLRRHLQSPRSALTGARRPSPPGRSGD